MEGNLRFKIDWASLTVGRKFTFFALFYFAFEGNCQVQAPGRLINLIPFRLKGTKVACLVSYLWEILADPFRLEAILSRPTLYFM